MNQYVKTGELQVSKVLYDFINEKALPESGVGEEQFWTGFSTIVQELMPRNKELLQKREEFQEALNVWHKENREATFEEYKEFLAKIGYLEGQVPDYEVTTENVDREVASVAGPQLVVPVNNARYALNAANARWGSLYDALYGTDAISEDDGAEQGKGYNPRRGEKVISFAREFLDTNFPLTNGSHKNATAYSVSNGELHVSLAGGETATLADSDQLVGYSGDGEAPAGFLLNNNGLHVVVEVDRNHPIGKTDGAGVKDILVESALTTIMDCEDSVTAVDAEDKVLVYKNLLGLMKGDLTETFHKGGKAVTRRLSEDRVFTDAVGGEELVLPGRSLIFVRNVGHLMTTDAVLTADGQEIPEGIMDTVITGLLGKHDLLGNSRFRNSREGSIYIVKPKMHGSKEVAFANELFNKVEDLLGLERHTMKIGVMDEERRTSLNLKACIREVKDRVVFINTGFLDRTGDEMHTSMEAGPMIRKNDMKSSVWLQAYEDSNVAVGLGVGFQGHAQIGKGMWAMPDLMDAMLKQKIGHLKAGANTAWVPSPTAATLHALHYHQVDVSEVQNELLGKLNEDYTDKILQIPVAENPNWTAEEIQQELDNNAQGILGYVVRWVEHGVGCSKVPDINNVALMEDRATLRISSQHMANWLHHGVCTEEHVMETLKRMAKVVDEQNADDPEYRAMSEDYEGSVAFQAACELVLKGVEQPSGYTEPILHRRRREVKEKVSALK
ncbi:MAG: malate synthase G [Bacillus sp. (in: Bacteria)]|nr:malate synthase G [Bacillus sp. (in: firmicutes)]